MIPTIKEGAPPGYLFLCPQKAFETGPFLYKLPDCPAYWSLDPLGVECLSAEDATSLGFPAIQLSVVLEGHSWDDSVYVGLRQFHQAKGFDPESQDIARHLGNPLYQVSSGRGPVFTSVNDEDSLTEVDDNLQASEEDALAVVSDEEVDEPASIHDGGTEVNEPMTIYDGDQEFNEQPSVHDRGEEADGRTRIHDEDSPVSQALKLTVSVQSILILFVILCSMYDVIW
ncbi:hypothetical protein B0H16DRAFT_353883 [Mycena metata]|uniref:Uncharacterized protein n=1 Tax=Mycena metata TaxID=1033252 RepID=A0AAD7NMA0_9AGAR|nr:hypothetical protein B0H16DRAFT_353883 [Mycena metata]